MGILVLQRNLPLLPCQVVRDHLEFTWRFVKGLVLEAGGLFHVVPFLYLFFCRKDVGKLFLCFEQISIFPLRAF